MITNKNLKNLNNYFTKQEFSFINGSNSENYKLNELNLKELNYFIFIYFLQEGFYYEM